MTAKSIVYRYLALVLLRLFRVRARSQFHDAMQISYRCIFVRWPVFRALKDYSSLFWGIVQGTHAFICFNQYSKHYILIMPIHRKSPGIVYAVASGSQPGIYFDWKDGAERAIRGVGNAQFQSFPSIAQAQRYLKTHGYDTLKKEEDTNGGSGSGSGVSGGLWITKSRNPILYSVPHTMDHKNLEESDSSNQNDNNNNHSNNNHKKRVFVTTDTSTPTTNTTDGSTNTAIESSTGMVASRGNALKRQRQRQHPRQHPSQQEQPPTLDSCQQRAIDAARNGENVFLTGVAGTGKSLVTKLIYEHALARLGNNKKKVALCAPTGMAAVGLGLQGQTIHSFAGLKIPSRASDFQSIHSRGNQQKWRTIECLIIDEVGMLSGDFLDWLDIHV